MKAGNKLLFIQAAGITFSTFKNSFCACVLIDQNIQIFIQLHDLLKILFASVSSLISLEF